MGLPLAFHSATGSEPGLRLFNRFFGVHALGFCWHNMLHLTNWLINGMPERFPPSDNLVQAISPSLPHAAADNGT